MKDKLDQHGFLWPTPAQELILRAALGEDESAIEHFHAWLGMINLEDEFDRGSYRLLPLLCANLLRLNVNHPLMGRLKGTYRRSWVEMQPRLEQAHDVLSLFHANGIETALIKGIPLATTYYESPVLRPMADFDIVVPHANAMQAIKLLDAAGWKRGPNSRDEDVYFHHAMQFYHPKSGEVDVHWHFLSECRSKDADRHFREGQQPLIVKGIETHQLGPTDSLLHTVIHGVRWNEEPPIRWIADAAMILRKAGPSIDWDRILRFCEREKLNYRVGLGLTFLAERFAMPIPQYVLETLKRRHLTVIERVENTIALADAMALYDNPLTKNWVIFARYCRFQEASNSWMFVNDLTHYFRLEWGLSGRAQLPSAIVRGVYRRLAHRKRVGGSTT